jgi:hypothetical protein
MAADADADAIRLGPNYYSNSDYSNSGMKEALDAS